MLRRLKANRFYFFIVGYTAMFAMLAFYGAEQATRSHMERVHVEEENQSRIAAVTGNKALYALPRLDLTMMAVKGTTHHVSLGIDLEIDKKSADRFEGFEPRVSDRIVRYLAHEDIDQFEGPNGVMRLRRDILPKINQASKPVLVSDVIFREFVVR